MENEPPGGAMPRGATVTRSRQVPASAGTQDARMEGAPAARLRRMVYENFVFK